MVADCYFAGAARPGQARVAKLISTLLARYDSHTACAQPSVHKVERSPKTSTIPDAAESSKRMCDQFAQQKQDTLPVGLVDRAGELFSVAGILLFDVLSEVSKASPESAGNAGCYVPCRITLSDVESKLQLF